MTRTSALNSKLFTDGGMMQCLEAYLYTNTALTQHFIELKRKIR